MIVSHFKKTLVGLLLCVSGYANAGLINNIGVEHVQYDVSVAGFGWQTSYDISFFEQDLIIDVDVFLTGFDAGLDLRNIWEQGIESIWSNAFDLFDGTFYYDTVFNVDWLNSVTGSDHTVIVREGDGNVNLIEWYTGNPSGWGYANQHRVAAHEFGHMIGLFDEYPGGATAIIRDDSIMGQNLTTPQADHFDAFTGWLRQNSGVNNISLVADSGTHFYQATVPEPTTIAIFLASLVGLRFCNKKKSRLS